MGIVSKASDYIALKNRVKNEVLRRKYTGSVESYGGTNYDFTVTPIVGGKVLAEHYNKINEPLRAINPDGLLQNVKAGDDIREITVMDAKTTIFESKPAYGTNHGCATSCTGLCTSSCTNTCTSCTNCTGCGGCGDCGGCTGCGDSCSSNCSSCASSCSNCAGTCGGSCSSNCSNCAGLTF